MKKLLYLFKTVLPYCLIVIIVCSIPWIYWTIKADSIQYRDYKEDIRYLSTNEFTDWTALRDATGYGKYRNDWNVPIDSFVKCPEFYHARNKYYDKIDIVKWPVYVSAFVIVLLIIAIICTYLFLIFRQNFGDYLKRFYDKYLRLKN